MKRPEWRVPLIPSARDLGVRQFVAEVRRIDAIRSEPARLTIGGYRFLAGSFPLRGGAKVIAAGHKRSPSRFSGKQSVDPE